MKYMLIKGSQWAGKAETIKEVCKRLKPSAIRRIHFSDSGTPALITIDAFAGISQGNYILTVRNKHILVVSSSPTQQRIRITTILEAAHKLNLKPGLAIVSVRTLERLKDFETSKELQSFGRCIYETKIWRIPSIKFNLTEEWNKRVSYITSIVLHNIAQ